jgi:hypothetical protein
MLRHMQGDKADNLTGVTSLTQAFVLRGEGTPAGRARWVGPGAGAA